MIDLAHSILGEGTPFVWGHGLTSSRANEESGGLFDWSPVVETGRQVVRYDAALSTTGGNRVETRRFEAKEPSDGTKDSVGPALNRAANKVAADVAAWIGSHGG